MRNYDDLTQALEAINRQWSQGHFTCWIGFRIPREKLPALHTKWLENYGTGLSAPERKNRKRRSLPTAWACVVPVMGMPHQAECVLLASPEALEATVGPFARENWLTRPPEVGDYVMVREPSNRGTTRGPGESRIGSWG